MLGHVASGLTAAGFTVETSKAHADQIKLPVLFGLDGRIERSFDADAFDAVSGTVVEVEAGRAVVNFQFLKDLFEACMMADALHLVVAVRHQYKGRKDFDIVRTFFETLYSSGRLTLPLRTVTVVGY